MTDQLTQPSTDTQLAQVITQMTNAFAGQNKRVTDFLNKHADEVYSNEVSPGRNRAIYLIGHLIGVNDHMISILGLGNRLYPQYQDTFVTSPDNTATPMPSIAELKEQWDTLNTTLTDYFNNMTPVDWLSKHTLVSDEDFAKDPQRNKLNVLISRTIHEGYHLGQLNFLKAVN